MTHPIRTGPDGLRWFVQTAGVGHDQGYRWLSLDGTGDEALPKVLVYQPVGGQPLADLLSERSPSVVLGRRPDRSFVLYIDGLQHPGAPVKGDYQGRPINTALLGYAPPNVDPTPLLAAAAAALTDNLAARLPLRWVGSAPVVDSAAGPWAPPALDPYGPVADLRQSIGLPPGRRTDLVRDLATLSVHDLLSFPTDRPLLLVTNLVPVRQLAELRPWRAVSPELDEEHEFKEGKRGLHPVLVAALLLAGLGLLALIWIILRGTGPVTD